MEVVAVLPGRKMMMINFSPELGLVAGRCPAIWGARARFPSAGRREGAWTTSQAKSAVQVPGRKGPAIPAAREAQYIERTCIYAIQFYI